MKRKNTNCRQRLTLLKKRIHLLEQPDQARFVAGNRESGGSGNSNGTVCTHWPPGAADTVCQQWPV